MPLKSSKNNLKKSDDLSKRLRLLRQQQLDARRTGDLDYARELGDEIEQLELELKNIVQGAAGALQRLASRALLGAEEHDEPAKKNIAIDDVLNPKSVRRPMDDHPQDDEQEIEEIYNPDPQAEPLDINRKGGSTNEEAARVLSDLQDDDQDLDDLGSQGLQDQDGPEEDPDFLEGVEASDDPGLEEPDDDLLLISLSLTDDPEEDPVLAFEDQLSMIDTGELTPEEEQLLLDAIPRDEEPDDSDGDQDDDQDEDDEPYDPDAEPPEADIDPELMDSLESPGDPSVAASTSRASTASPKKDKLMARANPALASLLIQVARAFTSNIYLMDEQAQPLDWSDTAEKDYAGLGFTADVNFLAFVAALGKKGLKVVPTSPSEVVKLGTDLHISSRSSLGALTFVVDPKGRLDAIWVN